MAQSQPSEMVLLQEETSSMPPSAGGHRQGESGARWSPQLQKDSGLVEELPSERVLRGIRVTLDNNSMWREFHRCHTEMIITKQGSRMFPYCRFRIAGLHPDRKYSLLMDIQPADAHTYRWNGRGWHVSGEAEHHRRVPPFAHPESPASGQHWMQSPVSFYRLKLTSDQDDREGNVVLHLNQRYLPRLHISQSDRPKHVKPSASGVTTFTFPQTEFMAVTAYQNTRFTQLKVQYNPFAKGLRDDTATKGVKLSVKDTPSENPLKKSLKFLLANHKPKSSKPQESKPQESKPQESKPQESKPQESKPQESKPQESKPQESKPQESIPQDSRPQESKPESRPQESKPQDICKAHKAPKPQSRSDSKDCSAAKASVELKCNSPRPSQKLFSERIREAHVALQRCNVSQYEVGEVPTQRTSQNGPKDEERDTFKGQTLRTYSRNKEKWKKDSVGLIKENATTGVSKENKPLVSAASTPERKSESSSDVKVSKRPATLPLSALGLFLKQHSAKSKKTKSDSAKETEPAKAQNPEPTLKSDSLKPETAESTQEKKEESVTDTEIQEAKQDLSKKEATLESYKPHEVQELPSSVISKQEKDTEIDRTVELFLEKDKSGFVVSEKEKHLMEVPETDLLSTESKTNSIGLSEHPILVQSPTQALQKTRKKPKPRKKSKWHKPKLKPAAPNISILQSPSEKLSSDSLLPSSTNTEPSKDFSDEVSKVSHVLDSLLSEQGQNQTEPSPTTDSLEFGLENSNSAVLQTLPPPSLFGPLPTISPLFAAPPSSQLDSALLFEPLSPASSPEPLPTLPESLAFDLEPSEVPNTKGELHKASAQESSVFKWHTVLPPPLSPFQASSDSPPITETVTSSAPPDPPMAADYQDSLHFLPEQAEVQKSVQVLPEPERANIHESVQVLPEPEQAKVHESVQVLPEPERAEIQESIQVVPEPERAEIHESVQVLPEPEQAEFQESVPVLPFPEELSPLALQFPVSPTFSSLDGDALSPSDLTELVHFFTVSEDDLGIGEAEFPNAAVTVAAEPAELVAVGGNELPAAVDTSTNLQPQTEDPLETRRLPTRPLQTPKVQRRSRTKKRRRAFRADLDLDSEQDPSYTVMKPSLEEVEEQLFVSFTSKEALQLHLGDSAEDSQPEARTSTESDHNNLSLQLSPDSFPSAEPPATSPQKQEEEETTVQPEVPQFRASPRTDLHQDQDRDKDQSHRDQRSHQHWLELAELDSVEDKISELEQVLLRDVKLMKHKQVIHPVLQEVGLKMALLDPTLPIDLQYLGIPLPLPPPRDNQEPAPADTSVSSAFVSRTGKASDVTQIKGWRDKFTSDPALPPEASPPDPPLKKNLSAFCSDMLDEYLETEGKLIDERASSFTAPDPAPVTYDLPAHSSSYVRTLYSVLGNNPNPAPSSDIISGFIPPSKRSKGPPPPTAAKTAKKTFKQRKIRTSLDEKTTPNPGTENGTERAKEKTSLLEKKKLKKLRKLDRKRRLLEAAFGFDNKTPTIQLNKAPPVLNKAPPTLEDKPDSSFKNDSYDFDFTAPLSPPPDDDTQEVKTTKRKQVQQQLRDLDENSAQFGEFGDFDHTEPLSEPPDTPAFGPKRGKRRQRRRRPSSELELLAPLESDSELCDLEEKPANQEPAKEKPVNQELTREKPANLEPAREKPANQKGEPEEAHQKRPMVTKAMVKQRDLEQRAFWEGKPRTYITQERASVALATLFTLKGFVDDDPHLSVRLSPRPAPRCLNDFCRLGCMCSSLTNTPRSAHCRRALCMFRCFCLKQKVVLLRNLDHSDSPTGKKKKKRRRRMKMAYVLKEAETVSQPASPIRTLWTRTTDLDQDWAQDSNHDPEALCSPAALRTKTRTKPPAPTEQDLTEDGQSCARVDSSSKRKCQKQKLKPAADSAPPVLRDRESLRSPDPSGQTETESQTCARIRVFIGCSPRKPRPQTVENSGDTVESSGNSGKLTADSADSEPHPVKDSSSSSSLDPGASPGSNSASRSVSKRLVLLANCKWMNESDRVSVLKVLCEAMTLGSLDRPFWIGPYFVSPFKPTLQDRDGKPCLEVKVHISTPKAYKAYGSGNDENNEGEEERREGTAEETTEEKREEAQEGGSRRGSQRDAETEDAEQAQDWSRDQEEPELLEPEDKGAEPEHRGEESIVNEVKPTVKEAKSEKYSSEKRSQSEFFPVQDGAVLALPFLRGISPAGFLTANLKGRSQDNTVQVNGKPYPLAKVQLGRMGALHPANRLAAYLTGRVGGTSRPQNSASPLACVSPVTPVTSATPVTSVTSAANTTSTKPVLSFSTKTTTTRAGGVTMTTTPSTLAPGLQVKVHPSPKPPQVLMIQVPNPKSGPALVPLPPLPPSSSSSLPLLQTVPLPSSSSSPSLPLPQTLPLVKRRTVMLPQVVSGPVRSPLRLPLSSPLPSLPPKASPGVRLSSPLPSFAPQAGVKLFRKPDGKLVHLIPISQAQTSSSGGKNVMVYRTVTTGNGQATLVPISSQPGSVQISPVSVSPTPAGVTLSPAPAGGTLSPSPAGVSGLQKFNISNITNPKPKPGLSFTIVPRKTSTETVVVRKSEVVPHAATLVTVPPVIGPVVTVPPLKIAQTSTQTSTQAAVKPEPGGTQEEDLAVDLKDLDVICVGGDDERMRRREEVVVVDSTSEETENSSDYSSGEENPRRRRLRQQREEREREEKKKEKKKEESETNETEEVEDTEKKEVHNFLEKRRRHEMNKLFHALRRSVGETRDQTSKISILNKARSVIRDLRATERRLKELKSRLSSTRDSLLNHLLPHSAPSAPSDDPEEPAPLQDRRSRKNSTVPREDDDIIEVVDLLSEGEGPGHRTANQSAEVMDGEIIQRQLRTIVSDLDERTELSVDEERACDSLSSALDINHPEKPQLIQRAFREFSSLQSRSRSLLKEEKRLRWQQERWQRELSSLSDNSHQNQPPANQTPEKTVTSLSPVKTMFIESPKKQNFISVTISSAPVQLTTVTSSATPLNAMTSSTTPLNAMTSLATPIPAVTSSAPPLNAMTSSPVEALTLNAMTSATPLNALTSSATPFLTVTSSATPQNAMISSPVKAPSLNAMTSSATPLLPVTSAVKGPPLNAMTSSATPLLTVTSSPLKALVVSQTSPLRHRTVPNILSRSKTGMSSAPNPKEAPAAAQMVQLAQAVVMTSSLPAPVFQGQMLPRQQLLPTPVAPPPQVKVVTLQPVLPTPTAVGTVALTLPANQQLSGGSRPSTGGGLSLVRVVSPQKSPKLQLPSVPAPASASPTQTTASPAVINAPVIVTAAVWAPELQKSTSPVPGKTTTLPSCSAPVMTTERPFCDSKTRLSSQTSSQLQLPSDPVPETLPPAPTQAPSAAATSVQSEPSSSSLASLLDEIAFLNQNSPKDSTTNQSPALPPLVKLSKSGAASQDTANQSTGGGTWRPMPKLRRL